jgi:hypothetical protein
MGLRFSKYILIIAHALKRGGCERIFTDEGVSGGAIKRPALDKALAALKPGDVLVVWKLDRLGRSLSHLIQITKQFGEGASVSARCPKPSTPRAPRAACSFTSWARSPSSSVR